MAVNHVGDADNVAWVMRLRDEETRDRIAEAIGLVSRDVQPTFPNEHAWYEVILPGELSEVARQYDEAYDAALHTAKEIDDVLGELENCTIADLEAHLLPEFAKYVKYFEMVKDAS